MGESSGHFAKKSTKHVKELITKLTNCMDGIITKHNHQHPGKMIALDCQMKNWRNLSFELKEMQQVWATLNFAYNNLLHNEDGVVSRGPTQNAPRAEMFLSNPPPAEINKNSAEIKADFDAMDVADYAKAVKLEGVDDGYDLDNLDMRDRVYDSEDSDKAPLGQLFGDVKLYETSDSDDSSMDVGQSYNNAGPSIVAGPSRKTDFAKKTKNLKKKSAKDDSSKTTRKLDFSPKQSKKKTSQKKQTPEPVYDEDMSDDDEPLSRLVSEVNATSDVIIPVVRQSLRRALEISKTSTDPSKKKRGGRKASSKKKRLSKKSSVENQSSSDDEEAALVRKKAPKTASKRSADYDHDVEDSPKKKTSKMVTKKKEKINRVSKTESSGKVSKRVASGKKKESAQKDRNETKEDKKAKKSGKTKDDNQEIVPAKEKAGKGKPWSKTKERKTPIHILDRRKEEYHKKKLAKQNALANGAHQKNAKEDERAQKQQEELERQAEAIALKNSKIYPKPPSSIVGSNQSNSKPAVQEQFVTLPVPAVSAVPLSSGSVLLSPKELEISSRQTAIANEHADVKLVKTPPHILQNKKEYYQSNKEEILKKQREYKKRQSLQKKKADSQSPDDDSDSDDKKSSDEGNSRPGSPERSSSSKRYVKSVVLRDSSSLTCSLVSLDIRSSLSITRSSLGATPLSIKNSIACRRSSLSKHFVSISKHVSPPTKMSSAELPAASRTFIFAPYLSSASSITLGFGFIQAQ
ncbi:unnamed protein product [Oikopleura dioica]|uniref:Uncharacterized protein n=1 Tax=Oikopleura dioica TaxID=34765 RepID=E4XLR0_OIKDI|nr:unnamed protein product [Oikopleura dioica]